MRKNFKDKKKEPSVYVPSVSKLTDWSNEPSVSTLRSDYTAAKPSHDAKISQINKWEDIMKARGEHAPKVRKDRSKVQPKTARRAAEWRYSALTEPFLSSEKLYDVKPTTFEDAEAAEQVEIQVKYEGYIERQKDEIEKSLRHENTKLPADLDYKQVKGLSNEVVLKLNAAKPETVGIASRISGITPAAISILLVHLKKQGMLKKGEAA